MASHLKDAEGIGRGDYKPASKLFIQNGTKLPMLIIVDVYHQLQNVVLVLFVVMLVSGSESININI